MDPQSATKLSAAMRRLVEFRFELTFLFGAWLLAVAGVLIMTQVI